MPDLYVPESYASRQKLADLALVEKATVGFGYGSDSVVLGPAGMLAGAMRQKSTEGRTADKAVYYYLYKRHPFIYACVELICQTAAQDRHTYPESDTPGATNKKQPGKSKQPKTPTAYAQKAMSRSLSAQKEDDGDEADLAALDPDDGMEFLEKFFQEVNEFESFNELLQAVYRDLLIFGEAFVLKQRDTSAVKPGSFTGAGEDAERTSPTGGRISHVASDPTSRVRSLHRIPSIQTFAVAGADGYPAQYRQKGDDGGWREYSVEDVIFIRLPDPNDPCKGLSPLEALDLSVATDLSAAKYNEAYFRNGAKAGLILSGQELSESEIRRNKDWLLNEYTRSENAHKPLFLVGNVSLVRDNNATQNDMEFLKLREFTREEICAVYSVPISKLLHQSDGMGSTGKMSDDMTFRADTVGPLQTKVYETFNRQLMRRDFPHQPFLIPPRQEKIRLDLLEAAKSLVQTGGTGNEARAILHLPQVDHPTMDLPLFLVPGLTSLVTDETANSNANGSGEPVKSGTNTDAQRADRTSTRTSSGQKNARAKGGTGMRVRKSIPGDAPDDGADV